MMIKVGGQFSGVGAFDFSLDRLGIEYLNVYQAEWDKYARQTYLANHSNPEYYVEDVNDTPTKEITEKHGSLDVYMTSPPCQSFSLAGKRQGKDDLKGRGILFFNSLEFIEVNKPRFFIFENVKGLLSSKNNLQYENILYLCISKFNQIETWQKLNTQKSNLNLLSQTLSPYLFMNWSRRLGLRKTKSGTSFISNSELSYERLEKIAKSGLKRRLKFLEGRIYQIMKKQNYCHQEQTPQLECKEEDLILTQEKLYLIENLYHKVTNMLEKTVGINVNTSLFANNILEENSKTGKLYTTLTELNSTIDKRTFMYVLEMNIIRLTTLALDLSPNLWKEIWHILTGKKGFTGLKTFDEWIYNLENVGYNLHWKVLNAKNYGVPQNRERVFIVGIRDDKDNVFTWPKEVPLVKRLKDVLESEVEEKYYLSDTMINGFINHAAKQKEKGNGFEFKTKNEDSIANSILTKEDTRPCDNIIKLGFINQDTQASQVYSSDGVAPSLCAGTHGYVNGYIDKPIVLHNLTGGKWNKTHEQSRRVYDIEGVAPAMHTCGGGNQEPKILQKARGYNEGGEHEICTSITSNAWQENNLLQEPKIVAMRGRENGCETKQMLEINKNGVSNSLTTVQKDNLVLYDFSNSFNEDKTREYKEYSPSLRSERQGLAVNQINRIRKLTPTECFRLMDFPDSLVENARKVGISNSQLYKQAGNSIVVAVLTGIISKLKL